MSRSCSVGLLAAFALGALVALPGPAYSAERIVFAEDFTATW